MLHLSPNIAAHTQRFDLSFLSKHQYYVSDGFVDIAWQPQKHCAEL